MSSGIEDKCKTQNIARNFFKKSLCWQSLSLDVHILRMFSALGVSEVFSWNGWILVHFQILLKSSWSRCTKKSSCWNFMGLDLENRKDEWIGFRYEIKQFSVPVFWDSLLCGERAVNLFKIYCSSETFQQFLECIFLMQSKSELLLIGQDCLCRASFLAWNLHDYKINLASSPVLNQ